MTGNAAGLRLLIEGAAAALSTSSLRCCYLFVALCNVTVRHWNNVGWLLHPIPFCTLELHILNWTINARDSTMSVPRRRRRGVCGLDNISKPNTSTNWAWVAVSLSKWSLCIYFPILWMTERHSAFIHALHYRAFHHIWLRLVVSPKPVQMHRNLWWFSSFSTNDYVSTSF